MKTILLTGASGDIGLAIKAKFVKEGYHVLAPTRQEMDLESQSSIEHYIKNLPETIDAFIHCAGINYPKLISELTEQDIQKTFQVNTLSFYTICKMLSNNFKQNKQGAIVGISSIYGDITRSGRLAYSASKYALNGMVKTLAIELGKYNIRVNAVAPGFVDTKLTRQNNTPDVIEEFKQKIPLGRLATGEDIAKVVYFLCSTENNYINGQCITVDGGYVVGGFQE